DVSCIKEIYSTKNIDNLFSILAVKKPEIVLIDTSLPDKSGIDVLRKIKQISSIVKIILVTNYPTEHYKLMCKENGADY
ncbi:response regulator, partial [Acinetobacter baumannii]